MFNSCLTIKESYRLDTFLDFSPTVTIITVNDLAFAGDATIFAVTEGRKDGLVYFKSNAKGTETFEFSV